MARDQYFVALSESGWKIKHNGEHSARYRSKTEAIQDAVAAACRAGKRGQDAQVIVQGEDLLFRTEWAYYGHDPYLPASKDAHPRQFGKGRRAVLLRALQRNRPVPLIDELTTKELADEDSRRRCGSAIQHSVDSHSGECSAAKRGNARRCGSYHRGRVLSGKRHPLFSTLGL
jgi:hypothetical protein